MSRECSDAVPSARGVTLLRRRGLPRERVDEFVGGEEVEFPV